ncbi:glycosyl hydrolase family 18 protein [Chryseobacterium daecheongense]|nr:glycosyl hydrolase family 18 protein [Chryseobacterium daecheongense]
MRKQKGLAYVHMILIFMCFGFISCQDDNEGTIPKEKTPIEIINSKKFKVTGYFNGLTRGGVIPDYYNLRDIPDGVDIVNLFHRFLGLSNLKRGDRIPGATGEDAKTLTEIISDVQFLKKRGTVVIQTQFANEIFENYKDERKTVKFKNTPEDYDAYAKKVSDSLTKWGIDGVDLDLEPGYTDAGFNAGDWELYIKAFAKYFGPGSNSGKLLIIDTNVGLSELGVSSATLSKIDLIYIQDYWGSEASTDNKIDGYIQAGFPKKNILLISADFESSYSYSNDSQGPLRLKKYYNSTKYQAKAGGYGAYGFNFDKKQDYKIYSEMITSINQLNQ